VTPARTQAEARRQLRALIQTAPAVLSGLTVIEDHGELVLAARRGRTPQSLTERVRWSDFVKGEFEPRRLSMELVAHLFTLSPSKIEKLSRHKRRNS
jgi:hypothetical protein